MRIDYGMLQVQRNRLLSVMKGANEEEKDAILGVINLLEGLLDEGIDAGLCRIDEEGNVIQKPLRIADNDSKASG